MKDFTTNTAFFDEGDIIVVDGKKYRAVKKTTTAVAVERYYWFDAIWDRYVGRKA